MKRTRRQKMAMGLAVFIAALLLVSIAATLIVSFMPGAQAASVTQAEIKKLKENKAALEAEKKRIQNELAGLKNDKADAVLRKTKLDEQINITNMDIENTSELITELTLAIAQQQEELDKAIKEEAEAEELFRKRVRVMEESGNATYLSILFQSKSFSDLLSRWDMINEIVEADQSLMDDLAEKRETIRTVKLQLESDKLDQLENRKELAARQSELADQYAQADELIAEIMSKITSTDAIISEYEADEAAMNKDIAEKEAQWKKQQEEAKKSTKYVGGEFEWPTPGYGTITSPYGMRVHPILKVNRMHSGIDIGAPKNAKIVASNAGTVIVATYSSSYGYYMLIDHGGGRSTLYAHQTKFADGVKVGTTVARGDHIGYVGSTGLSTGNHLHFEIRIDGKTVNPEDYLKKK